MYLPNQNISKPRRRVEGFALVLALSLMAFVLLLLLSMTSLVQVENRSAQTTLSQLEAEQSALLGLLLAVGDLQKTAGHDQRITVTADLTLPDSGNDNRRNWVGVWDSSLYDPSSFNLSNPRGNKSFVKWLVSNKNASSLNLEDAGSVTINDPFVIFDGTVDGTRESQDVEVDEISVLGASGAKTSSYAYWVEDNGLKADISWNETTDTRDESAQAARLSSAPGIDPRVFQDSSNPYTLADSVTLDNTLPFIRT